MRILLTGKNGQLGRCFLDVASSEHEIYDFGSDQLNISDPSQVAERIAQVKPDIIVNAAAYTAVDKAEEESERAYAVNELGVKYLAEQAVLLDIPVIHVSTDYVFDGKAVMPYLPSDQTNPRGVYGASKLAGEKALAVVTTKYIVLRTAWVFSEYGNNFVKSMIRLAKERDSLNVVADQYGCPTYAGDLAVAIKELCEQYQSQNELPWGIYHYCGDTPASWHGFARTIFALAKERGVIDNIPKLSAISSDQYPTPAKRPEYSVLNLESLHKLGVQKSQWIDSLNQVLIRLM
ncbi:dTDP-4-dehydrorhamnose reductase [Marinomonas balearica]|uniref:dTDP-4-dehydrorhamnose reductase n=1 Tax=Marinomonas balearica TaxID=491947 RepID=A0A4R6M5E5_9GAMM|nr:dTDP-4-dehydrorhamnose reductase [Marinomonas balearica]TDO95995.1 dTDP-4-dehydrorhamnose reductase [Marinomonas balearica]